MPATFEQMTERVLAKCVETETGCWEFTGAVSKGYGRVGTYDRETKKQRVYQAHRVVYIHLVGPISDDLVLDHLCKNRRCVNPDHLDPVTPGENTERAVEIQRIANANKTECPRGHRYTPANTYTPKGSTARYCRECGRIATRKWRNKTLNKFNR
jgi:hypothetical protein